MSCRKRFFRLLGAALIASGAVLSACGGGGDGNGGDGGDGAVAGYPFDNANMMTAAGLGAEIVEFFPGLSQVNFQVLSALALQPPQTLFPPKGPRPNAVIPVPLPGVCANEPAGTANLTWDDKDNDARISAADVVTLAFANCIQSEGDVLRGTATYTFLVVSRDPFGFPDNVTVDQVLDVTVSDIDVMNIRGNLRYSFLLSLLGGAEILYGGTNRSDVVTVTINGLEAYKFGCFDVSLSIPNINTPEVYSTRPRGIANVGGKIMQLGSYFGPDQPFQFQVLPAFLDPVPVAGTLTLVSIDARPSAGLPTCTAVGSPGNISSNLREILITATGGGNVRVDLKESNGSVISTQNTTWDNLFN